jgi:hypothetical protein
VRLAAKREPSEAELVERPGAFDFAEAAACNTGTVTQAGGLCIGTPPEQWSFAAVLPLHGDAGNPFENCARVVIRVEATVEQGSIGVSIFGPDKEMISNEDIRKAGPEQTTFEVRLDPPPPGALLVVRNAAASGKESSVRVHSVKVFVAPETPAVPLVEADTFCVTRAPDGFVPVEQLAVAKAAATQTL